MREEIKRATREMFDECGGRELTAAIKAALLTVEVYNIEMAELKKRLEAGKKAEEEMPKMTVSPNQGIRAATVLSRLSKEWRVLMEVCAEEVHRAMEQMIDAPSAACNAAPARQQVGGAATALKPELVSVS